MLGISENDRQAAGERIDVAVLSVLLQQADNRHLLLKVIF